MRFIIRKAFNLRNLLNDASLRKIVSMMDTLPSVPSLYIEMSNELRSPDPSIQKVAQIISRDPGMTLRILQLLNSAFFGRRRNISNAADAVAYLGLDRVQHLFLTIHAFSQFSSSEIGDFSIEQLWEQSLSLAMRAKGIAEKEGAGKEIMEDAFTGLDVFSIKASPFSADKIERLWGNRRILWLHF